MLVPSVSFPQASETLGNAGVFRAAHFSMTLEWRWHSNVALAPSSDLPCSKSVVICSPRVQMSTGESYCPLNLPQHEILA